MNSNTAQKALTALAILLLVGGAAVVVITLATWPSWNPYEAQANTAALLDVPVDQVPLMNEPMRVDRWSWIGVGSGLFTVGILAGLLALHAASIRSSLRAIHA